MYSQTALGGYYEDSIVRKHSCLRVKVTETTKLAKSGVLYVIVWIL